MIDISLDDRYPGVPGFDNFFELKFFIRVNDEHIGPGCHDFRGFRIIELKDVVNQHFFLFFNFPLLFNGVNKGHQFFFGESGGLFDFSGEFGDEPQKNLYGVEQD